MKRRLGEDYIKPQKQESTSKKQQTKYVANTIDEKHTEMLRYFDNVETTIIPKISEDIIHLKNQAKQHTQKKQLEEYFDVQDKIQQLNQEIQQLKKAKKKYLLENSKYIFDYFEHKKDVAEGGGQENTSKIHQFFKIKGKTDESSDAHSEKYKKSRFIYHNYWKSVNNEIVNIHDFIIPSDICEKCHKGELIPQDEEGILICNNRQCGAFITHIVDSAKPANKEPPNEVSYTAYIRLNHFKEILSQFQAKETTQIPQEVIEAIRARIKKERITDLKELTYDKMRDILRKLNLNKYFEHIQYINSIFGIKPPIMNEELHETLCVLFIEIQKPWALHCPATRTNFFNYTYTLYQLCVLLDQTQYLPYIILMKDVDKQREQDQIWKKVCQDLDWEFIPSI
jgi:Poxvirus Late Transcription Factor VLTF3 like